MSLSQYRLVLHTRYALVIQTDHTTNTDSWHESVSDSSYALVPSFFAGVHRGIGGFFAGVSRSFAGVSYLVALCVCRHIWYCRVQRGSPFGVFAFARGGPSSAQCHRTATRTTLAGSYEASPYLGHGSGDIGHPRATVSPQAGTLANSQDHGKPGKGSHSGHTDVAIIMSKASKLANDSRLAQNEY